MFDQRWTPRRTGGMLFPLVAAMLLAGADVAAAAQMQTDTLTLNDAVRMALTNSPTLRQAEAQQLQESAGGWEAWDRLLPRLSFSSGFGQTSSLNRTGTDPIDGGVVVLPDSMIQLRESFGTSASINANWTLFDGGRNLQAFRRARAQTHAADLEFEAARSRIVATVTTAYIGALEAAAEEEAFRAEVRNFEELERTAIGRFEAGEAPEVEALQARLNAGEAQLALLDAGTRSREARLILFEHLRLPQGVEPVLAEPPVPAFDDLPSEEELRTRALSESAELAALEARVKAAERTFGGERWWFLPSVSVSATWSRSESGANRDGFTFTPRNEGTRYGLSFSWNPLEQPGGTAAAYRRASASVHMAEAQLDLRRAELVRQVESALDRLAGARVLQEQSAVNVRLGRRQREQQEERYRVGVGTLSDRLDAEMLAARAARQEIAARYAALSALAELEQASGVPFLSFE